MKNTLQQYIYFAGLGQIALAIGSLVIPRILKWRIELAKVNPLVRQLFWTYAAYILIINLCFGMVSVFDFKDLTDGSTLAILLTGFIAVYWISRIMVQFFYFDRTSFPAGVWNVIGEVVLVTLFIFLSIMYSLTFYFNYQHNL